MMCANYKGRESQRKGGLRWVSAEAHDDDDPEGEREEEGGWVDTKNGSVCIAWQPSSTAQKTGREGERG